MPDDTLHWIGYAAYLAWDWGWPLVPAVLVTASATLTWSITGLVRDRRTSQ